MFKSGRNAFNILSSLHVLTFSIHSQWTLALLRVEYVLSRYTDTLPFFAVPFALMTSSKRMLVVRFRSGPCGSLHQSKAVALTMPRKADKRPSQRRLPLGKALIDMHMRSFF